MSQLTVKGMLFDAEVAPLLPRMDSVNEHREALQRLQDNWDHLTLLGQMSDIAADITATGEEFKGLSGNLLNTLAHRLLDNMVATLQGKAQVAIDILVRNLFERTADVGFLATDTALKETLCQGLRYEDDGARLLAARFKAYVAKYSVYDDVIVLGPQGQVLARLDEATRSTHCTHPFVSQTLSGTQAFVERFDHFDVLDGRRGLLYGCPIRDELGRTLGALALSFKLDDEMAGIFHHLIDGDPFQLLLLCDTQGRVIASSDAWRIPVGAALAIDPQHVGHQCISFAGRIYVAVMTKANSYQGYGGPGWMGCALMPLEHAFDRAGRACLRSHVGQQAAPSAKLDVDASAFFDEALQRIPRQARRIQHGLARSVWNWELHTRRASGRQAADNNRFAAALLQQVSLTGERIRGIFERAITELGESVAAAVLHDTAFRASLAIDIMDRNLYERANDCRWWAMDGSLREALAQRNSATQRKACEVLTHINSLYTVYTRLVLLDTQGQIVASSGLDAAQWLGQTIQAPWVKSALTLQDDQAWARSAFESSAIYGDQPTYIYAAAIHDDKGRALGATAIVFDAAPQFHAMLRDALPLDTDASPKPQSMIGLFVTRSGMVVASTDARFEVGQQVPFPVVWGSLPKGQSMGHVLHLHGMPHAAGISMAAGYREYQGACMGRADDVLAMVLVPIHHPVSPKDTTTDMAHTRVVMPACRMGETTRTLATFLCNGQHIGVESDQVIEALENRRLTAMPNSPAHLAGLLLHHGKMLPVIDLHALRRGVGMCASSAYDEAPSQRMLVVCTNTDGFRFALVVEELAGIVTVPDGLMHPLPEGMSRHDPSAEGIVRFQEDQSHGAMMIILSLDKLAACLHVPRQAEVAVA